MKTIVYDIVANFRRNWKSLFWTDFLYKVLALVLLTPLLSILFRVLITLSGNQVLADIDIARFFLGPAGWLCLIACGAVWLGIVALEFGALMAILAAPPDRHIGPLGALRFASANAWPILQVAVRIVGRVLLVVAPFLAVAAAIYTALLSGHDINYYLQKKPPEFLAALACGGLLALGLAMVLIRLVANWFYALPLVLFENVSPKSALRESGRHALGHRRQIVVAVVIWLLATSLVSALVTGLVIGLGRLTVPGLAGSLPVLVLVAGTILLLWSVASLLVNLLGTTTFASLLFSFYEGPGNRDSRTVDPKLLAMALPDSSGSRFRMTRTRVAAGLIVGLLAAVVTGLAVVRSIHIEDKVEIMAHRGASGAAPENTMAAVQKAIEDGADWVEIDVQETSDGEVVVFHDSDFMKLANNPLKIWDARLEDLQSIDIGSWFAPEFADQRVPTLEQVLAECRGRIKVNIELKYYGHDQDLENRVARIVQNQGMENNVVLMSLQVEAVKKMKALRPDWKVGLLMSVAAGDSGNLEADFLAVNAGFADRSLVKTTHQNNQQILVWTVNDPFSMSAMIGRGVDGLITDEPAMAREVLRARAQMTFPERLILEFADLFGVHREIADQ